MASASDSFDRTSGDIGANWTQVSGAWAVSGASVAKQTTAGASYRSAVYTATPPDTNDYTVSASVRSENSSVGAGVVVRASSTAVTDYRFSGYGGDSFYLEYLNAGAASTLATGGAMAASTTYYITLRVSGSSISASVNGVFSASANNSALSSGGWGLASFDATPAGNSSWIDSWSAADDGGSGGSGGLVYRLVRSDATPLTSLVG